MPAHRIPLAERLLAHRSIDSSAGCWLWTGGVNQQTRYGNIRVRDADGRPRTLSVHRVAIKELGHVDPGERCVLHRCDRRACFNPEHLFLGSVADNNRDMREKRRHAFAEKNGQTKLSTETAQTIKRLLLSGVTQQSIADRFGVARTTVSNIATGSTWACA